MVNEKNFFHLPPQLRLCVSVRESTKSSNGEEAADMPHPSQKQLKKGWRFAKKVDVTHSYDPRSSHQGRFLQEFVPRTMKYLPVLLCVMLKARAGKIFCCGLMRRAGRILGGPIGLGS